MLHGDSVFACTTCSERSQSGDDGLICREARRRQLGRLRDRSSGSEERREHWQEVHRRRVRLIRQQETDDHRSQSHGLAKQSADQCNATRFPQGPLHVILCMH